MPATKTPPATVVFVAKGEDHVLIRRAHNEEIVAGVGKRTTVQPIRYRFESKRLVAVEGKDVLEDGAGWLRPDAKAGVKRDMIEALKAHREFGTDFWIEGHDPGTLYPRPQEFREMLMGHVAALDEGEINAMLELEQETHGRGELIREAAQALVTVQAAAAKLEEQVKQQGGGSPPAP